MSADNKTVVVTAVINGKTYGSTCRYTPGSSINKTDKELAQISAQYLADLIAKELKQETQVT